jgi:hypothetical protein
MDNPVSRIIRSGNFWYMLLIPSKASEVLITRKPAPSKAAAMGSAMLSSFSIIRIFDCLMISLRHLINGHHSANELLYHTTGK